MGLISGSAWRTTLATLVAALAFASLYEITMPDSEASVDQVNVAEPRTRVAAGQRLPFSATAYCKGIRTASGVAVRSGVAAADPRLLPVGSVVQLHGGERRYNGIYTIMDTGPAIHGRELDIYMWNCNEALTFGRRLIHLEVLRLGWNPRATSLGRLLRPYS